MMLNPTHRLSGITTIAISVLCSVLAALAVNSSAGTRSALRMPREKFDSFDSLFGALWGGESELEPVQARSVGIGQPTSPLRDAPHAVTFPFGIKSGWRLYIDA